MCVRESNSDASFGCASMSARRHFAFNSLYLNLKFLRSVCQSSQREKCYGRLGPPKYSLLGLPTAPSSTVCSSTSYLNICLIQLFCIFHWLHQTRLCINFNFQQNFLICHYSIDYGILSIRL